MAATPNTIDHATLKRLVEAGSVRRANIVGLPGGWGVVVQHGKMRRGLAVKQGAVRIFRKFETLVPYLKEIGIARYEVDATRFDPKADMTGRKRADAAARLKNAHDAAAYKGWLVKEVQASIDDPRPSLSHEQVAAEWAVERAALLKRVEHAGG